jgi:hypothetical protein
VTNITSEEQKPCYDVLAMRLSAKYVRSLSLFVIVFLCLSPAAVLCLAYCNSHVQANAAASHCPLKRQGADCPHSSTRKPSRDITSIETGSARGCALPINIIGAPLESKFGVVLDAPLATAVESINFAPVSLASLRQIPRFDYRPPPNDIRFERVRNQVFRI